jgi:hypothetical protein
MYGSNTVSRGSYFFLARQMKVEKWSIAIWSHQGNMPQKAEFLRESTLAVSGGGN